MKGRGDRLESLSPAQGHKTRQCQKASERNARPFGERGNAGAGHATAPIGPRSSSDRRATRLDTPIEGVDRDAAAGPQERLELVAARGPRTPANKVDPAAQKGRDEGPFCDLR
jgi:hypothetical protein